MLCPAVAPLSASRGWQERGGAVIEVPGPEPEWEHAASYQGLKRNPLSRPACGSTRQLLSGWSLAFVASLGAARRLQVSGPLEWTAGLYRGRGQTSACAPVTLNPCGSPLHRHAAIRSRCELISVKSP